MNLTRVTHPLLAHQALHLSPSRAVEQELPWLGHTLQQAVGTNRKDLGN
jgi:hypothetical protein